jgi:hypothetical protein
MEPYLDAEQGTDSEEMLQALESCGRRFALLRGAAPQTPFPVTGLLTLDQAGRLTGPTAVIAVEADPDGLEPAVLLALAQELAHTKVPGVLVVRDDIPVGVVDRGALIKVLPLDLLAVGRQRHGVPDVSSLRYECHKCAPPSIRLLRAARPDGEAPWCIRDFFHGAMERAAL